MKIFGLDGSLMVLHIGFATIIGAGVLMAEAGTVSKKLKSYQEKAKAFQSQLTAPTFETAEEEVHKVIDQAIADAEKAGDTIAQQDLSKVTFDSTLRALDDLSFTLDSELSRIYLIKETAPSESLRGAAAQAVKKFQEWYVGFQYREDVYKAIKAYAETNPKLTGERAKFLKETVREYQRLGFDLPKEERQELEELKKTLAALALDFRMNINNASHPLLFTLEDLEGVPESFLNQEGIKTGEDEYTVMANITWHFTTVMDNTKKESTRKKLFHARFTLAKEENLPILEKVIGLRDTIAKKLGYKTWADYQTEVRMAKNGETVKEFLNDLYQRLQPKFEKNWPHSPL